MAVKSIDSTKKFNIYHFDMYRITTWDDLYSTGFFDYLDAGGICAVEWSEKIEDFLPDDCYTVAIEKTGEETREITISR